MSGLKKLADELVNDLEEVLELPNEIKSQVSEYLQELLKDKQVVRCCKDSKCNLITFKLS